MRWSRYSVPWSSRSAKSSGACFARAPRGGRSAGSIAIAFVSIAIAFAASANELRVAPRTIPADGAAVVTLTLEGSFAKIDDVDLPLRGLAIEGGPSVSSQFQWTNGRSSRSKIYTWRVRPLQPGRAIVGPLRLADPDGKRLVLSAVTIQVEPGPPPLAPGEATPVGRLLRDGRGVAIVPVIEPRSVVRGEQIDATWYLYVDADQDVRGARAISGPELDGFWAEELQIDEGKMQLVEVDGQPVHRVPLRRMALFPLRSGTLQIGEVEAAVRILEATRDPFGVWNPLESRVIDVRRTAPKFEITVGAVPEKWSEVGTYSMRCSKVRVPASGPVSFDTTLEGRGNLRSAKPPSWEGDVGSESEVDDLGITVMTRGGRIVMRRTWRYLLFPDRAGRLDLPALSFHYFDPAAGAGRIASCGTVSIDVPAPVEKPRRAVESEPAPRGRPWRIPAALWIAIVAVGTIGGGLAIVIAQTRYRRRPEWSELVALSRDPREARVRIDAIVESRGRGTALFDDPGDLGDAYRALIAVVDLMRQEPWEVDALQGDYRLRVKDFIVALGRRG